MTPAAPPVRDLLDLRGHVALVTGAGAGIGTGIAARLAEAGAHVAVHYHRSDAGAREVVSRIVAAGGTARAYRADLTDAADVHDLRARITADTGVPDILVNNAGTYPLGSILDVDAADWQAVVAANLTSVHLVTQAVARGLARRGAWRRDRQHRVDRGVQRGARPTAITPPRRPAW